jgi:hypothetical protein
MDESILCGLPVIRPEPADEARPPVLKITQCVQIGSGNSLLLLNSSRPFQEAVLIRSDPSWAVVSVELSRFYHCTLFQRRARFEHKWLTMTRRQGPLPAPRPNRSSPVRIRVIHIVVDGPLKICLAKTRAATHMPTNLPPALKPLSAGMQVPRAAPRSAPSPSTTVMIGFTSSPSPWTARSLPLHSR